MEGPAREEETHEKVVIDPNTREVVTEKEYTENHNPDDEAWREQK